MFTKRAIGSTNGPNVTRSPLYSRSVGNKSYKCQNNQGRFSLHIWWKPDAGIVFLAYLFSLRIYVALASYKLVLTHCYICNIIIIKGFRSLKIIMLQSSWNLESGKRKNENTTQRVDCLSCEYWGLCLFILLRIVCRRYLHFLWILPYIIVAMHTHVLVKFIIRYMAQMREKLDRLTGRP